MKFGRKASAKWKGSGKDEQGSLTAESYVLVRTQYSFHARFEDGEKGTNPEELIGAGHAGCFSMQLSLILNDADFIATVLDMDTKVTLEDGKTTKINLNLEGGVPSIDAEQFQQIPHKAKEIYPISALLNTEIELKLTLKST
jgi:osmotically inducible protein OsmC